MATKKDLVEAHAFSRRRLVTAFVSGAPGGREVEPTRPGRMLVGGLALSLLLLAGAAVAGFLVGRPPAQWLDTGSFVISKDTGEQYVVLRGGEDPLLQRVPNYVSAQLLLGEPELTPYTVRDKYIRQVSLGEDLGIERAPAGLPSADELISQGWTACTGDGAGTKLTLRAETGATELVDSAFLVTSGARLWLIATAPDVDGRDGRAYRYQLPADPTAAGALADRLGFGATEQAPVVDAEWLNLFPLGAPLSAERFAVASPGRPARYAGVETDLSRYRTGDLLLSPTGGYYLLGDEQPQRISEFAGALYDAVVAPAQRLEAQMRADLGLPEYPQEWPDTVPTAVTAGPLCAVLHPEPDAPSRVVLAADPDAGASPEGLRRGRHDVDVEPGGGAYVLSGADEAGAGGTPYVIDPKGTKYSLVGPLVPAYIGYGDTAPPVVPNAWLEFFDEGVPLSVNAARRVPEDAPEPAGTEASS